MTTKEILVKARELISDPKNFLTGRLGGESEGAYCAVGAVLQAGLGDTLNTFPNERERLARGDGALAQLASLVDVKELDPDPYWGPIAQDPTGSEAFDNWNKVVNFNNTKGHECVLNLFDAAIERQP